MIRLPLSRVLPVFTLALLIGGCRQKAPQELLTEGNDLFSSRELIGAEASYQELVEKHPQSEEAKEARVGLALCYLQQQEFDRAREQLDAAISAYGGAYTPKGFETSMLKLQTFLQERQPKLALEEAIKTSDTMRKAPVEGQIAFQVKLSELYMINERTTEALAISQKLVEGEVPSPEMHGIPLDRMVQIYMGRKDYASAVQLYHDFLKRHPKSELKGSVLFGLGFVYKEAGDKAASEEALNASEAYFMERVSQALGAEEKCQALIQASRVREFRGNHAGATEALQRVLKDYPSAEAAVIAYRMLVDQALGSGDPKRALALLEEMDKKYPNTQVGSQAYQLMQTLRTELQQGTGTLLGSLPNFKPTTGTLQTSGSLATTATLATTTTLTTGSLPPATITSSTATTATARP